MDMRILAGHFAQLKSHFMSDNSVEQGCFALCRHVVWDDNEILLIQDLIFLETNDLNIQELDFLSVKPQAMLRVAKMAQKRNLAICMIHNHPMENKQVRFSSADDLGNESTFEFFNRMLPEQKNSCLVFNKDVTTFEGRVYNTPHEHTPIEKLSVVGEPNHFQTTNLQQHDNQFDRQARLLGAEGQAILSSLTIAVVGSGGIGSNVAQILAHAGVGKLILIDSDFIELSNLPRIVGATQDDVENETLKVEVVQRYIKQVQPNCEVVTITSDIQESAKSTLTADAIVCTTDNSTSREFLNRFCWQYFIPLLDLGVQFVADDDGKIINEIGKVNWILPDTPCLWCLGHVSSETLREEEMKEQGIDDGYIRNIDEPEPSMMPYNMMIAARGAQVLIGNLIGLSKSAPAQMEIFTFLGTNKRKLASKMIKRKKEDCWLCGENAAYLGAGDEITM